MKTPVEIASIVNENMPSIGFLSRKKRIEGFNLACHMVEELSNDEGGNIDMEKATEAAVILAHMNNKFHKASYMTALNINHLSVGALNALAYTYAQMVAAQNQ